MIKFVVLDTNLWKRKKEKNHKIELSAIQWKISKQDVQEVL